jgi:endonuclease YncB( thermonuclease family)
LCQSFAIVVYDTARIWRAYVSISAALIAVGVSIGATWVVRMRLDLDRLPSIALATALLVFLGTASYIWLRNATTGQVAHRLWVVAKVELLALGLAAALFAVSDATDLFAGSPDGSTSRLGDPARVERVVDGDTIIVILDGTRERVRYIGIDTPKTVDPNRPGQPYGPEASARNKELLDGETVYLEKDISERDVFQRLLRYVRLEDGRMVNMILVEEGSAQAATYPPDVKHAEEFVNLQREASDAKRGLWGL